MIETEALTKKFGDVTAVDDLTLRVDEGEVFGFLGPNGAGKTTTVRILTCLVSKSDGEAWVDGHEIGKRGEAYLIRKATGLLPETVGMYDDLSVSKNLDYYGKLYDMGEKARAESAERLLRMLGLWEKRASPVGTFSKGTKQKVAIARALIHDPKVVFLDEPTANLDPESSKSIRQFILELKKEGKTVFVNTHNLDEAQRVCDRVGIMKGKLMAAGAPDVLRRSLWPARTVVRVLGKTEPAAAAIGRAGGWALESDGDRLLIDVDDPEQDNPLIITALVSAGVRVMYVTELSPSLEEVYLRLVGS